MLASGNVYTFVISQAQSYLLNTFFFIDQWFVFPIALYSQRAVVKAKDSSVH